MASYTSPRPSAGVHGRGGVVLATKWVQAPLLTFVVRGGGSGEGVEEREEEATKERCERDARGIGIESKPAALFVRGGQ